MDDNLEEMLRRAQGAQGDLVAQRQAEAEKARAQQRLNHKDTRREHLLEFFKASTHGRVRFGDMTDRSQPLIRIPRKHNNTGSYG